ncbi:MFS transporter [Shimazuella sp. AN120528]|uniref:MFS transporter n=1 Tax=Shimazuella soli TaxID=1892854 RepID=UPI001F0E4360|nr:MFS transporter [Shimazuella soli]MCH5584173.1 MFS transporter [Shimazuella soli]
MTTTKKAGWGTLLTLCSIPIIMVLGNSMLIPVFSSIQGVYEISSSKVGLLITLFSFPAACMIPIAGFLADRIGRKKVIIFSLILYGLGGVLSGIVAITNAGFSLLLWTRVVQGIGAAGTAPIAMVLTSDVFDKAERSKALGTIEAANGMGKVLSPILGSVIALISWYAMFFVFPVLCIPTALALIWLVKEQAVDDTTSLKTYLHQVKTNFQQHGRWLGVAFYVGAITMFTMFGALFALSDALENSYGLTGIKKGLVLAVPLLALCITSFVTGRHIKDQIGKMKQMILFGLFFLCLPLIVVPWVKNPYFLVALFALVGIGAGLVLPCLNMMITSAIRLKERGIITSLYSSVRFFGVALGPPIFGALADRPFLLYFGTAAFIGLALLLSFFLIHRPQRIHGKEDRSRILVVKKQLHPS